MFVGMGMGALLDGGVETLVERLELPDFSYAGYAHGVASTFDLEAPTIVSASAFGVVADDSEDDSRALAAALEAAMKIEGPVVLQLPPGRLILTQVLFLERGDLAVRGAGSGSKGTTLWCPRPMKYFEPPDQLKELREYLLRMNKRQREANRNLDLPYSPYSWAGGMLWTQIPEERVKAYLPEHAPMRMPLARVLEGEKGNSRIRVDTAEAISPGMVVQLEWYNREGPKGSLLKELYPSEEIVVGSHHWEYPDEPLVRQQVEIVEVEGTVLTLSAPLLMDCREGWAPTVRPWPHLRRVGIEHLRVEFPDAPIIGHHLEEGFNAIYLTRVFDGWVDDVVIVNADSGVLTEEVANVTIRDVTTSGNRLAHYSVQLGGVHHVLVENLQVFNRVRHPLSFNTFATLCVYTECEVFAEPLLDQHSGANHQNLFDAITVHVTLGEDRSYPLFKGGGAGYWKPAHGDGNTFWNIRVRFEDGFDSTAPVRLDGMRDGPGARLVGVHGNLPVVIEYGPAARIEHTNEPMDSSPSLYRWQLQQRLEGL